jgi:replicative superfamily II helicase
MHVSELENIGVPKQLIEVWADAGITELTDIQASAFSHGPLVEGRKNAIIVAPTSAGKTFIGEALGALRGARMRRVVYLVPYKALADEKYWALQETYGTKLGMSVVVSSGDHYEFDVDIRRGNFLIAVIVYEKFAHLLLTHPGLLQNIGLLVVDEIQMIRDPDRGSRLYDTVRRLRPTGCSAPG